jgi:hypothetical protein
MFWVSGRRLALFVVLTGEKGPTFALWWRFMQNGLLEVALA